MLSLIRAIFGLPFWVWFGLALALVYMAELEIQAEVARRAAPEVAAADAPEPARRGYYRIALVAALFGLGRLLAGPPEARDSPQEQMRRVEATARLARDLPPAPMPEAGAAEPAADPAAPGVAAGAGPDAGGSAAYAPDSPFGRLKAKQPRDPGGDPER